MRKKYLLAALVTAFTIGLIVFVIGRVERGRRETVEYDRFLQGNARASALEFIGHQKRVRVEDPDIIKDFESALKHPSKILRTGTTWNIHITLMTGVIVKTAIYISDDKKGVLIADYNHLSAGDPTYISVDFPETIGEKTKSLLKELAL